MIDPHLLRDDTDPVMTHSVSPGLSPARPDPLPCPQKEATEAAAGVLTTEINGLTALRASLSDSSGTGGAFARVVDRIASLPGRLVVSGMGKSGHIGRKIQATLVSTGTPAIFVHPAEASHGDLGMLSAGDAVLALSNSGESSELADIVAHTRRYGLPLFVVTSRPASTLAQAADVALITPDVPEACPMGMAPTTSCVMQLALGDALAVALMKRRGFTAGDFGVFHPGGRLGARLRTVRDLMRQGTAIPCVAPSDVMRDVIVEMTQKALGCVAVVDEKQRLLGIITDGDLRGALDRDLNTTRADSVMNARPLTTGPDSLAAEALRLMNDRPKPITSLFVLNQEGSVIGVVHVHDLLRAGVA